MNGVVALVWEVPKVSMAEIQYVGFGILLLNAMMAFCLNVSVVFLIGKTSSLVLTLCGVLKDIILVGASMLIWGTQVSALQFFGYAIALGGLVYYKLGADQIIGSFDVAARSWSEFGSKRPATRKAVVIGSVLVVFIILLGGLVPTYAPEFDPVDWVRGMDDWASEKFKTSPAP